MYLPVIITHYAASRRVTSLGTVAADCVHPHNMCIYMYAVCIRGCGSRGYGIMFLIIIIINIIIIGKAYELLIETNHKLYSVFFC